MRGKVISFNCVALIKIFLRTPKFEFFKTLCQIVAQLLKSANGGRWPRNQDIVVAAAGMRHEFGGQGAKAALGPVSGNGIADSAAGGKSETNIGRRIVFRADLEDESGCDPLFAVSGNGQEFGAFLKNFEFATRGAQAKTLGRKLFAALRAAAGQNLAATLGCHAGAKAMTALTDQLAGLISTFHVSIL